MLVNAICVKTKIYPEVQMETYLGCSQRVYSNYEHGELDIPTAID